MREYHGVNTAPRGASPAGPRRNDCAGNWLQFAYRTGAGVAQRGSGEPPTRLGR